MLRSVVRRTKHRYTTNNRTHKTYSDIMTALGGSEVTVSRRPTPRGNLLGLTSSTRSIQQRKYALRAESVSNHQPNHPTRHWGNLTLHTFARSVVSMPTKKDNLREWSDVDDTGDGYIAKRTSREKGGYASDHSCYPHFEVD